MRNLYRVSHSKHDLKNLSDFGDVDAFIIDQTNDDQFYYVAGDRLYRVTLNEPATPVGGCEEYAPEYPIADELILDGCPNSKIIAVEHLLLTGELCCALSEGSVVVYNLNTSVSSVPTHCGHGIKAMQWSPDQELVVFVDGNMNVVTMIGSEYEAISEVQLNDDTFGDRQFMSVGWGKKETQFHGSAGKAAAKKSDPDEDDDSNDREHRDTSVDISWRGDGEYFAVAFLAPFGQRAFKVFNKEGVLQYTSERCNGLRGPLAWRPSGQWIAITQVLGEKCVIALFEKNGLRHREIPLPLEPHKNQKVVSLHWSPDSDVLAVHWVDGENCTCYVDLYVIGNYHWYLKQRMHYTDSTHVAGMHWDQRHSAGKTLHLLTLEELSYERIRFEFRVDRSVGHGEDDEALVAVIDSNRLLLTNFRRAVIPPPMCSYTLEQKHPINAVGFIRSPGRWISTRQDISSNAFYTIDSFGEITLYDVALSDCGTRSVLSGVKELLKIDPFPEPHENTYQHWMWINPDHLVMVHNGDCAVFYIEASDKGRQQHYHDGMEEIMAGSSYESIHIEKRGTEWIGCIEASGSDKALVELSSGRLLEVDGLTFDKGIRCKKIVQPYSSTLPAFCEQLFTVRDHPEKTLFALAPNRRNLYRNGTLIASDVTSALLTESYLLCTTISELKFISLRADERAVARTPAAIVGERKIERGSKLVTVVAKASRTVFQLPRGNLEAINPRVLSLCLIAKHLDALEYYEAFDIMRKERINLNLLVDHDFARFMAHLGSHFLVQITNVNWLNLFITDLSNQDARQMYESNYLNREDQTEAGGCAIEEKVRFCCERLLEAMDPEPTILTLPKITCHVKQGQLEKGLALIWTLKQKQPTPDAAEEALRYLLYLVEVNVLYNVALGMYDFGLVLFVATKSQKDPKEYLPFLNELKRMEEDYRKYRIDCHLKRYDRALEHIARYESDEDRFQEAIELIGTHQLYTVALRCYRGSTNQTYYQRICALYGDFLRKGGKHADASLMYERAGDLQQAVSSARHALDWRRVVRLSTSASIPADAVLRSLVPALLEAGEYDAAATIAHDHMKDTRLAVDCLLKDHRYERALLLAASEPGLQDTIRLNLGDYLGTLETTLTSEKEQFLHQKGRLAVVREERLRKRAAAAAGEDDGDGDADCGDCDLFSDNSTIASSRHTGTSGRSGKSHRSSKNRRKHERKLLNLKEGNPFEDIALIDALHALVVRVCGVERQRHVRAICQVAIELRYDTEAQQLQHAYGVLFQLIRYSLDAIWVPEMIVPGLPPAGGTTAPSDAASDAPQVPTSVLTPADLVQAQDAQRYALIKPHQRYKPDIQSIPWQWDVLK
ncbi:elongator complex protein 1 [Anopheles nili]|uniref:elongator complex protein 1 n=1 Tax=Anopheles nili TaxID=185578 RepID=UPI00237A91A5|nr:elongator complex protein 1 [Anopheles nili]